MTYQKRFSLTEKRFSHAAKEPPSAHFAVQITLTGEEAGIFYIANTERGFEIAPYDYHDNTATLQISGDDLVKLLGGRLNLQRACESGRVQISGNMEHILLLARIVDPPASRTKA